MRIWSAVFLVWRGWWVRRGRQPAAAFPGTVAELSSRGFLESVQTF